MAQSSEKDNIGIISADHLIHNNNAAKCLEKMQNDWHIPIGGKSSTDKVTDGTIDEQIYKPFPIKVTEQNSSSPESIKNSEKALDSKVSGLLPQDDQKLLKSLSHGVVDGDSKAFGEAVASFKGDPVKLKEYVNELQKNLDSTNACVNTTVTKDGNVIVYEQGDSTGVQFDGKTGQPCVVPLENENGNVILGTGEVLNKTPEGVMKSIGQAAREGILGFNCLHITPLFPRHMSPDSPPDAPVPAPSDISPPHFPNRHPFPDVPEKFPQFKGRLMMDNLFIHKEHEEISK